MRATSILKVLGAEKGVFRVKKAVFSYKGVHISNSNIATECTDLQRGCIHINFIKIGQILIKLRPHPFFSYLAPKKVIFE